MNMTVDEFLSEYDFGLTLYRVQGRAMPFSKRPKPPEKIIDGEVWVPKTKPNPLVFNVDELFYVGECKTVLDVMSEYEEAIRREVHYIEEDNVHIFLSGNEYITLYGDESTDNLFVDKAMAEEYAKQRNSKEP